MDTTLMTLSSYEVCLSVFFGLVTIFLVTKFVEKIILKERLDEYIRNKNNAVGIFLGSITTGILLIVNGSIEPAVNSLHSRILGGGGLDFGIFARSMAQFALFYVIALVVAFIILGLSLWVYMIATRNIDEIDEIKKGNLTIALILGFTLISFSLFVRPAAKNFLGSLVNYEMAREEMR